MSKSFYLYLADDLLKDVCDQNDIYCFKNKKIIAVDKQKYNRKQRYGLQKLFHISPYYVNQRTLKEIITYSQNNPDLLRIRDIEFLDNSIYETADYKHLANLISNNSNNIFSYVLYMLDEYDTDIYKIKFRYNGFDISISSEGVINMEAPEDTWENFIMDTSTNNLILGLSIN